MTGVTTSGIAAPAALFVQPTDGTGPSSTGKIGDVRWRQRACVTGQVRSVRIQPLASVPSLECTLVDETGGLTVVFLGRRKIAGIQPGTRMRVEGVAGNHRGQLAILNPRYELIAADH